MNPLNQLFSGQSYGANPATINTRKTAKTTSKVTSAAHQGNLGPVSFAHASKPIAIKKMTQIASPKTAVIPQTTLPRQSLLAKRPYLTAIIAALSAATIGLRIYITKNHFIKPITHPETLSPKYWLPIIISACAAIKIAQHQLNKRPNHGVRLEGLAAMIHHRLRADDPDTALTPEEAAVTPRYEALPTKYPEIPQEILGTCWGATTPESGIRYVNCPYP